MSENLFDNDPGLRASCANAVAQLEAARAQRGVKRRRQRREDASDIRRAFQRAAREDAELRALKAKHPRYSGLWFGRYDSGPEDGAEIAEAAAV